MKRIQATVIAGLLLLTLILPQSTLAAGPGISNVSVPIIAVDGATITWTTNTTSDSRVNYGTTTGLGETKYNSSTDTTHNIILSGLNPNTKYYFEVESTDISGTSTDNNGGAYYSFTTLAPATYSVTLDHACGVCGELWQPEKCDEVIGVTAIVAAEGTYHICWDSLTNSKATFTASGAGTYTLTFRMPEAKKGDHKVYLTDSSYTQKGDYVIFTVNPSVKINPEEGPVGTEVTLNGYGFDASQDVQVSFLGEEKTDKANTVGSWEIVYTIPDTPSGGYTFDVGPKADPFVIWLSKYFKVTPQITVTPSSGTVGRAVKVEGTGFASEEEDIEITFDGEVRNENITADQDGSWTANIAVPVCTCGSYDIGASGETTRARNVDPVKFTVVAGIAVSPAQAEVGKEIIVTGGGFVPEEDGVKVTFGGTVVATDIAVDTYGCWQSSFTLPASTYGAHTVSASGETTAAVTTDLDTKAQITEFSPAEGAPGDSIALTCNGFHGSQDLTVTVGGVAVQGNMQTQSNGNVVINFHVPKGSPAGKQTLVVTDEGGATDSVDFTVQEKTLSIIPLPISPKDDTLRSGEVTFRWIASGSDSTYGYSLEVSKTKDGSPFRSESDIKETSYTLTDTETETETLEPGTYYWRVKVVDDYGNQGDWSDSIEFKVAPIPTWVWVVIGVVVLVVLMVVAYRETKFKITK